MLTKNLNIFYTDDDADDHELFSEVVGLLNKDYRVFGQTNGDQLLRLLKSPPPYPDVVFLDLNMPEKSGFDVLKEIRAVSKFKHLPVVIFSTSNSESTIRLCKTLGATMYVTKPESYPEMLKTIKSILSIDWSRFDPSSCKFVYTLN
jgi:CheY-like chemotaxis protein